MIKWSQISKTKQVMFLLRVVYWQDYLNSFGYILMQFYEL